MPQSLLTGQLKEKPTHRAWCLYSSFVHVSNPMVVRTNYEMMMIRHCMRRRTMGAVYNAVQWAQSITPYNGPRHPRNLWEDGVLGASIMEMYADLPHAHICICCTSKKSTRFKNVGRDQGKVCPFEKEPKIIIIRLWMCVGWWSWVMGRMMWWLCCCVCMTLHNSRIAWIFMIFIPGLATLG